MEDYFRIFLQTWKFSAELIERFCVLYTRTLACMNLMLSRSFKADGTIVFNSYKLMIVNIIYVLCSSKKVKCI